MARCIIVGVLVTYLVGVLQATLSTRFAVVGVSPDLPLVWGLCVGLLGGPRAGALAGFGAGLIEGALRQAEIGALSLSRGLGGLGAGLLATKMFRENWLMPVVCAVLMTLVSEAVLAVASRAGGWHLAGRIAGVRVVYHSLLTPVAVALADRACKSILGRRAEAA